jgi:hypothetical protein
MGNVTCFMSVPKLEHITFIIKVETYAKKARSYLLTHCIKIRAKRLHFS